MLKCLSVKEWIGYKIVIVYFVNYCVNVLG